MRKVYFITGSIDTFINVTMQVKTERREGSNAHHVIFTDEAKELADHTTRVDSATFLIPEYNEEGYGTNKFIQLNFNVDGILALADKIRGMQGSVVNMKYGGEDDDLPF